MASSVFPKEGTSFTQTHSGGSKKKRDLPAARNAISKQTSAANGRKKWEKGNNENVGNAAGNVLGSKKKAEEVPVVAFVDTKSLRIEFAKRAEEDPVIAAQRKNILGTIELLEDAECILKGAQPKYKHFDSHKRGDKKLLSACAQLHEGVKQAHERAEALGFPSYFFSRVLPKNGCYEKTTDKINLHNAAFLGGALFLREMANIYQAQTGALRPIALEAFQEFLEPFAQKFPYSREDLQTLVGEGILAGESKGRSQEIVAALNDLFEEWVAIDGGENLMRLEPFKTYLKSNAAKKLSAEEMEQFDAYVDAFFRQNGNAEKMLIDQSKDWS